MRFAACKSNSVLLLMSNTVVTVKRDLPKKFQEQMIVHTLVKRTVHRSILEIFLEIQLAKQSRKE